MRLTDREINAFFMDDMAEPATFKGSAINVIFDSDPEEVVLHTGAVETSSPQARCKSSDVSSAVHGDEITINGVVYKIIGIEPDGTGFTTLILSRD